MLLLINCGYRTGVLAAVICVLVLPLAPVDAAGATVKEFSLDPNPHTARAPTVEAGELEVARTTSARAVAAAVPLWGGSTSTTRFAVRTSADARAPRNVSSDVCLACHDGVSTTGGTGHGMRGAGMRFRGGRLQSEHPTGVDYASADTPLRSVFSRVPGSTAQVANLLLNGRVECTSCHAMRHDKAIPGTALIRTEYAGAAQHCMVCHDM